jgi:hypothetical protein
MSKVIVDNIVRNPGGQQLLNDVNLRINSCRRCSQGSGTNNRQLGDADDDQ